MNVGDIEDWAKAYKEGYEDRLHDIERNLNDELQSQGYITQDQLEEVIEWKLDNQGGRRGGNITRINQVSDEFIRLVSEAAFVEDDPKVQVKTLASIPGIGYATATVVLTFYDPANYAVGDRYILDMLFGEDKQMGATDYPRILSALRDRNPGDFDLRTVEKAYYQKYRVDNGLTDGE